MKTSYLKVIEEFANLYKISVKEKFVVTCVENSIFRTYSNVERVVLWVHCVVVLSVLEFVTRDMTASKSYWFTFFPCFREFELVIIPP